MIAKELYFDCTDGATPAKILFQLEKLCNEPSTKIEDSFHSHEHYSLAEIFKTIDDSEYSLEVKNDVKGIFEILTKAECEIHGESRDEIHFHEIGRKANILRLLRICYLVNKIAPEKISASKLNLGFGKINCSHGILDIPAPATKLIIQDMDTYTDDKEGELTTPTGAAIIKYYTSQGLSRAYF